MGTERNQLVPEMIGYPLKLEKRTRNGEKEAHLSSVGVFCPQEPAEVATNQLITMMVNIVRL